MSKYTVTVVEHVKNAKAATLWGNINRVPTSYEVTRLEIETDQDVISEIARLATPPPTQEANKS